MQNISIGSLITISGLCDDEDLRSFILEKEASLGIGQFFLTVSEVYSDDVIYTEEYSHGINIKHIELVIPILTDITTIHLTESEFREEVKQMIIFAINEKDYTLDQLNVNFIAEDLTGRFGNIEKELPPIACSIIQQELTIAAK